MRNRLIACCALFAVALAIGLLAPLRFLESIGPFKTLDAYDAPIFYCAAREIGHTDPYRLEPLATCERTIRPRLFSDVAAPAPQPGYVLAGISMFAWLEPTRFVFVWIATLCVCALGAAAFLGRLTAFPVAAIFAASLLGSGYENLEYGQLSMVVYLGIVGSGFALSLGRPRIAALLAGLTLAEPHVALPVFVCLFVLERRARVTLVAVGAVALGVMLAVLGPAIALEYVSHVLPLQALTEARNPDQYSATLIATLLGASDRIALAIADAQYVVFALGAIVLARRLRERWNGSAFVTAMPAAAAVIGGPFIHYSELLALLPAVLLLASCARNERPRLAAIVVALVVFPWRANGDRYERAELVLLYALVMAAVSMWVSERRRLMTWLGLTIPIAALGLANQRIPQISVIAIAPALSNYATAVANDTGLSPVPWGYWMREHNHILMLTEIITKAPTIVAIGIAIYLAIDLGRNVAGPSRNQTFVNPAGIPKAGSLSETG